MCMPSQVNISHARLRQVPYNSCCLNFNLNYLPNDCWTTYHSPIYPPTLCSHRSRNTPLVLRNSNPFYCLYSKHSLSPSRSEHSLAFAYAIITTPLEGTYFFFLPVKQTHFSFFSSHHFVCIIPVLLSVTPINYLHTFYYMLPASTTPKLRPPISQPPYTCNIFPYVHNLCF